MAQSTRAAAQALSCLAAPLGHDHGPLLFVPVAGSSVSFTRPVQAFYKTSLVVLSQPHKVSSEGLVEAGGSTSITTSGACWLLRGVGGRGVLRFLTTWPFL